MEYSELFKIFLGLLSAISAIAVYKFNIAKSLQARAELIQQFEEALVQDRKYSVCEIFRLLHGLRMSYEDIRAITRSDNVSKILYVLNKTPGFVRYENGELKYSAVFEKRWVRLTNNLVSKFSVYFFGAVTVMLIIAMAFSKGLTSFTLLILLIPSFAFLTMQIKDLRHDKMIDELVNENTT